MKCLIEKVDEQKDCDKKVLADIEDEKDKLRVSFLKMKWKSIQQQKELTKRIQEIRDGKTMLLNQVEESKTTLISKVNTMTEKMVANITKEGEVLESKYNNLLKQIDDDTKRIGEKVSKENSSVRIADLYNDIEKLELALKTTFVPRGNLSVDFEMAEQLKDIHTSELGEYVLEKGVYDTIGKYLNKGFEKDDQEKKDEIKPNIYNANERTGPVGTTDTNNDILKSDIVPQSTIRDIDPNKSTDTLDEKSNNDGAKDKVNNVPGSNEDDQNQAINRSELYQGSEVYAVAQSPESKRKQKTVIKSKKNKNTYNMGDVHGDDSSSSKKTSKCCCCCC
ncbi:hypothetical protein DPMN_061073 [Dreissena polymorpha]|uniref:Uncharacterized protein n=2 Tax=Dreissena polymorpha TaxID=45954 RepID=A0A9D4C6B5_DREPO|nr:hypothetical protein DPMN_061073 [Dreissena polymorpha]